jgi:hypothetical protein
MSLLYGYYSFIFFFFFFFFYYYYYFFFFNFISCSDTELNFNELYELMRFGRILWTSDQPVTRPLPTQDSTT